MQQIIIPKSFTSARDYPFAEVVKDAATARRVILAICRALAASFAEDKKRLGESFRKKIQTAAEEKRRADICGKWFRILRAECGYTTSRALSTLDIALRAELDGGVFEPPKADGMYSA